MGLDVSIETDRDERLDQEQPDDYYQKYLLSRTFCNFLIRPYAIRSGDEPELTQLGHITGLDVTPLERMQTPSEKLKLAYWFGAPKGEARWQPAPTPTDAINAVPAGNLLTVLATVQQLLAKLLTIDNLPRLLDAHGNDTLGYEYYFTDFLLDKGQGYFGNNFGQDLRNFERFLQFAQSHGATTAWFSYG